MTAPNKKKQQHKTNEIKWTQFTIDDRKMHSVDTVLGNQQKYIKMEYFSVIVADCCVTCDLFLTHWKHIRSVSLSANNNSHFFYLFVEAIFILLTILGICAFVFLFFGFKSCQNFRIFRHIWPCKYLKLNKRNRTANINKKCNMHRIDAPAIKIFEYSTFTRRPTLDGYPAKTLYVVFNSLQNCAQGWPF